MTTRVAEARVPGTRVRFTPRAAIVAVSLLVLILYLLVPVRTYFAQRHRLAQFERQASILEQQNASLAKRVKQLQNPAYLERIARECLGMVKPGEIAFVVVPKSGRSVPADC
jgi:cell division protein FtsB